MLFYILFFRRLVWVYQQLQLHRLRTAIQLQVQDIPLKNDPLTAYPSPYLNKTQRKTDE